ncbi:MAG: TlpA family protein disulfide reductase [Prevotellaceae bacterium]|nr:TlpA family protein disulfide reductase [Prevotellaceae bacterium]
MKRCIKWIFIALIIGIFTSFISKNKPTGGLAIGNEAPDFHLRSYMDGYADITLSSLKGKYVLLSFWAGYDASSRMLNANLNNVLRAASTDDVALVSVSFDEYASIFQEAVRGDSLAPHATFVDTRGASSKLFKTYRLGQGFTNYLLDADGVIVAKNITPAQLSAFLEGTERFS